MIHFGLDQRAKSLRIERFAHNRTVLRRDARGALPPRADIRPGGPDRLATTLPVGELTTHLETSSLPTTISRSAGGYLCNFLYYHSLEWACASGCRVLFVHIPAVNGNGPFTEPALLSIGQEILRFALSIATSETAPHAQNLPLTPLPDPQGRRGRAALDAKGA